MLKNIEERPEISRCEKLGTKIKLNSGPDSNFESGRKINRRLVVRICISMNKFIQ